ncbi:unnamed protein product [Lactuca virosa]|uniref:Uncharacterized protein n=1 Tax=Lactuca virosa TaxID=75947 RepID=A0AAU9LQP5_9ASTR|nr:unnamed protein product [Lactuca virosa]
MSSDIPVYQRKPYLNGIEKLIEDVMLVFPAIDTFEEYIKDLMERDNHMFLESTLMHFPNIRLTNSHITR